ncbi:hypothetical protein BDZ90DRAFT_71463 [Jaminaea rosea]|uniref:Uncharacterized protein n=1 Tax=Jaminaea rosea TaxID=1569628 RepID=A0A316URC8_9BASI|nr:hypothetical protein BDZ90DRAFT_71463 [Jaminaea rosea]PWN25685.1 hypothetical protein BDZ90DRAFT_71463 [Jaminaea rosea]
MQTSKRLDLVASCALQPLAFLALHSAQQAASLALFARLAPAMSPFFALRAHQGVQYCLVFTHQRPMPPQEGEELVVELRRWLLAAPPPVAQQEAPPHAGTLSPAQSDVGCQLLTIWEDPGRIRNVLRVPSTPPQPGQFEVTAILVHRSPPVCATPMRRSPSPSAGMDHTPPPSSPLPALELQDEFFFEYAEPIAPPSGPQIEQAQQQQQAHEQEQQ